MKKYNSNYPMYSEFDFMTNQQNENSLPNYIPCDTNYQPMFSPSGLQIPNLDEDGDDNQDIEYMKSMYPDFCKRIQAYIDEECDRLEYDGSYMYDEYPDRETVERITDRLYDTINKDETIQMKGEVVGEDIETQRYYGNNNLQRDLIKIIFLNELFNRRRYGYYGNRNRRNRGFGNYFNPYQNFYRNYFY